MSRVVEVHRLVRAGDAIVVDLPVHHVPLEVV